MGPCQRCASAPAHPVSASPPRRPLTLPSLQRDNRVQHRKANVVQVSPPPPKPAFPSILIKDAISLPGPFLVLSPHLAQRTAVPTSRSAISSSIHRNTALCIRPVTVSPAEPSPLTACRPRGMGPIPRRFARRTGLEPRRARSHPGGFAKCIANLAKFSPHCFHFTSSRSTRK